MGIITSYSSLFQYLVTLTVKNTCLIYGLNLTGCSLVGVAHFSLNEKVLCLLHFSPVHIFARGDQITFLTYPISIYFFVYVLLIAI